MSCTEETCGCAPGQFDAVLAERWQMTVCDDGAAMVHTDGDIICTPDPNHPRPCAYDEARFRLIAAAPELLAVLQSLMPRTLIGETYETPVPADEPLREFLFTWGKLRAARAAIAKATGQ